MEMTPLDVLSRYPASPLVVAVAEPHSSTLRISLASPARWADVGSIGGFGVGVLLAYLLVSPLLRHERGPQGFEQ